MRTRSGFIDENSTQNDVVMSMNSSTVAYHASCDDLGQDIVYLLEVENL